MYIIYIILSCSCLILPLCILNTGMSSVPYNAVCFPRDSSYFFLFLRTWVSVMTRVDTPQMLNGLMHVQMNQPMGATRYKNICMEEKNAGNQVGAMRVVNYLSTDWVALRWGGWCVLGSGKGVLPNSIYPSANKEGDCLIGDEVLKGTLLDV